MCAGFTPNAHDAPCRKRASESKQNQWDRARSPKGESSIISESTPCGLSHGARGRTLGHTGGITTARNESLPPVHNRPMNSPLEGKSASCNPARL